MIRAEDIKELRARTGASISEVKKALLEAGGDRERAIRTLEQALGAKGEKKSERATLSGVIDCYVHTDRRIGVLVEVLCETDFVARNIEFQALVHDITLHIAAMDPLYVRGEDIPEEVSAAERRLIEEETARLDKPKEIIGEIVSGKLESHFQGITLLAQPFVKNPDKTVGQILNEAAGKFGENIRISRFVRFSL